MRFNFFKKRFISFNDSFWPLLVDKGPEIVIIDSNKIGDVNEFYIMPDIPNNRYDATLICPKCKQVIPITSNHTKIIDREGKITLEPSVLCEDCGVHFFVKQNKIYFG